MSHLGKFGKSSTQNAIFGGICDRSLEGSHKKPMTFHPSPIVASPVSSQNHPGVSAPTPLMLESFRRLEGAEAAKKGCVNPSVYVNIKDIYNVYDMKRMPKKPGKKMY